MVTNDGEIVHPTRSDTAYRQWLGQLADLYQWSWQHLFNRLSYTTLNPKHIVALGCRDGHEAMALSTHYPSASVIGIEPNLSLLKKAQLLTTIEPQPASHSAFTRILSPLLGKVVARHVSPMQIQWQHQPLDALNLPTAGIDLMISNLQIHWNINNLSKWQPFLRPNGLLAFSYLSTNTWLPIRRILEQLLGSLADDWLVPFMDMHDMGDYLVALGYADPVVDMEPIALQYDNSHAALVEFTRMGGWRLLTKGTSLPLGAHSISFKRLWQAICEELDGQYGTTSGIAMPLEVVFVQAWGAQPRQQIREQFIRPEDIGRANKGS